MSEDNVYQWEVGNTLPRIHPHSFAKHTVIRKYLQRYTEVVTGFFQQKLLKICLVDGFCGGGLYLSPDGNQVIEGSPFILLREPEATVAKICIDQGRELKLDAKYFFCDMRKKAIEHLKVTLRERGFGNHFGEQIFFFNGKFEDQIDSIVEYVRLHSKNGRAIFLLDQYGYNKVSIRSIQKIFASCRKAEVILTFNVDWMLDRLAPDEQFSKIVQNLDIDNHLISKWHSIKHAHKWRIFLQNEVYRHIIRESGATSHTKFFIRSTEAHRSYWLLHLSNHPKARDEMAKIHWSIQNHFTQFGSEGIFTLGFDPENDIDQVAMNFFFDDDARARTIGALLRELPYFIETLDPNDNGITYENFFALISNRTPASSDIINHAISVLCEEEVIMVLTKLKNPRRRPTSFEPDDVIKICRQSRFVF